MKSRTEQPTITPKFRIEVPTHKHDIGRPAVFKVWFGKHYLIWKGKRLLQSCEFLAEGTERYIRLQKNEETDYLYHVCNHIKRTRCQKATVEVMADDFTKEGSEVINALKMLKLEQQLLDESTDGLCLNNNSEAYVPSWVSDAASNGFFKWLSQRKCKASPQKTHS